MSSIKKDANREFGVVMALAFTVLTGLAIHRERPSALLWASLVAFFLVPALFNPALLAPLERRWMKFAEKLSFVMTGLIMTAVFFLALTPLGVLMRLTGRDPLKRKLEPEAKSYWLPVDPSGPGSRPHAPY